MFRPYPAGRVGPEHNSNHSGDGLHTMSEDGETPFSNTAVCLSESLDSFKVAPGIACAMMSAAAHFPDLLERERSQYGDELLVLPVVPGLFPRVPIVERGMVVDHTISTCVQPGCAILYQQKGAFCADWRVAWVVSVNQLQRRGRDEDHLLPLTTVPVVHLTCHDPFYLVEFELPALTRPVAMDELGQFAYVPPVTFSKVRLVQWCGRAWSYFPSDGSHLPCACSIRTTTGGMEEEVVSCSVCANAQVLGRSTLPTVFSHGGAVMTAAGTSDVVAVSGPLRSESLLSPAVVSCGSSPTPTASGASA